MLVHLASYLEVSARPDLNKAALEEAMVLANHGEQEESLKLLRDLQVSFTQQCLRWSSTSDSSP